MENLKVKIKTIDDGTLPEYKRIGDVCMDCKARLSQSISIPAHSRCLVNLGFALELPEGYEAVIRPRSGLSFKAIDVQIGTIDMNYRGEVKACVVNNTDGPYDVNPGDRICQLAIREAPRVVWDVVSELSDTVRGESGFGSSGL